MSTAHGFGAPDEGSNISKFEENRTKPERRKFVRRHASSVISSLEKKPCIDFDFALNARKENSSSSNISASIKHVGIENTRKYTFYMHASEYVIKKVEKICCKR